MLFNSYSYEILYEQFHWIYLQGDVKLLLVTVNNRFKFEIEIVHDLSCHPIQYNNIQYLSIFLFNQFMDKFAVDECWATLVLLYRSFHRSSLFAMDAFASNCYLRQWQCCFTRHLYVCLSVCLPVKNRACWSDFHEIIPEKYLETVKTD